MNSLLASAVASFGTRCRGLTQPVLRAVRLLTPTYSDDSQRTVAEEYTRATGYQVVYTQQPQSRIAAEVLFQLATNVSLYDGWTLDVPTSEAILRARGVALLDELAADPAVKEELADSDVHPFFQEYGALYDGNRTGVVISGQVPLLYWRRDVFARFNLSRAPASWDQLLAVARLLNGTDLDGDGTPDAALCWQTEGCIDSSMVLASVLASLTQYQGRSTGWLFNPHDMALLAAKEPLRRALGLFRELTRYELRGSSGCTYAATAFLTGSCALTVKYGHHFKLAELGYKQLHGKVGVAPLPGSSVVWDREASAWLSCDAEPSPCIFATVVYDSLGTPPAAAVAAAAPPSAAPASAGGPTAAAVGGQRRAAAESAGGGSTTAGAVGRVNRAPFCGMAALMGGVDWRAPADYQAAAFKFFAQVTSPSASWKQLLDAYSAVGPFRRQHLDPANVDRWLQGGGYDREDLLAFLEAWSDAIDHSNAALPLRLPGAAALTDALYWAAQQALGNRSIADLAAELGTKLQGALNETGLSPEEIQRVYWRNIHFSDQPAPPATQTKAEGWSYGIRVGVAVAVTVTGLALFVLLSYIWYGRRRRRLRRTLFGRALAPGASPATSLVVTDIVDSTRLWETVPPAAMARAIQLHHDTLRSLLELHNGYESATEGDSFILSFYTAADAVAFALRAQAALLYQPWPEELVTVELCRPQFAVCRAPGGLCERPRAGIPRTSLLPSRVTQPQTSLGSEALSGHLHPPHITGLSPPRIAAAADGLKAPRQGTSRAGTGVADGSLYGAAARLSNCGGGSSPLLRLQGAAAPLAKPKLAAFMAASMSCHDGGGAHSMPLLQRRRLYAPADGSCGAAAAAAGSKALSPVMPPLASGSGPLFRGNQPQLRGRGPTARLCPSTPQLTLPPVGAGSPGGSQSQSQFQLPPRAPASGLPPSRPSQTPPRTSRDQHRLCKRPPGRGRPASGRTLPYMPRGSPGAASLLLPPPPPLAEAAAGAAAGAGAGAAVEPAPSGLLHPAAMLSDASSSTPRIGSYSPPLPYSSDTGTSVQPRSAPRGDASPGGGAAAVKAAAPVVPSNCTPDVSGALLATTGFSVSSVSNISLQLGVRSDPYGISSTHNTASPAAESSGVPMAAVAAMTTPDKDGALAAAAATPSLPPPGAVGGAAGRALDSEQLSMATFTGMWPPAGSPAAGAATVHVMAERTEESLLELEGFPTGTILLEGDIVGMAEEHGHVGMGMSTWGPAAAAAAGAAARPDSGSCSGLQLAATGVSLRAYGASRCASGIDGAVAAAETRTAGVASGGVGSIGGAGRSSYSGSALMAAASGALSSASGAITSASLGLMPCRRTSVPLIAALISGSGALSGIDSAAGGGGAVCSLTLGAYYQQLYRLCPTVEAGAVRVTGGLQVRIGVHSGVASTQVSYNRIAGRTQYSGAALETAKSVCDAAQGGMVLLSRSTFEQLTRPGGGGGVSGGRDPPHVVLDMGTHIVKSGPDPVRLYMAQSRELLARLAFLGPVRSSEQLEAGVLEAPLGDVSMGTLTVVGLPTLTAWDKRVTEEALATFRQVVISEAMRRLGGHLVEEGPGRVLAAFGHPYDAIRWAAACEALLKEADWSEALLSHELAEEVQGPLLLNNHMDAPVLMANGELSRMLFRGLRVKGAVDCCAVRAELVAATGRLGYRGNLAANVQRIAAYVSTGQVVCTRRAWQGYEASLELAAQVAGEADVVGARLGAHSIRGVGDKVELWSIRLSEGLYDDPYDEDFAAGEGAPMYITQPLPSDSRDLAALESQAALQEEGNAYGWRPPPPPQQQHPQPAPLQLNYLPPVLQSPQSSRWTQGPGTAAAVGAAGGGAAAAVGVAVAGAGGGDAGGGAGGGGGGGGMGFRLGASLAGALQVHSCAWDVPGEELRNMLAEQ